MSILWFCKPASPVQLVLYMPSVFQVAQEGNTRHRDRVAGEIQEVATCRHVKPAEKASGQPVRSDAIAKSGSWGSHTAYIISESTYCTRTQSMAFSPP